MPTLKIDYDRCSGDGACVRVCPAKLYVMGDDGFPRTVEGAESSCIACGHCLAACPEGAIGVGRWTAADCPPATPLDLPEPKAVDRLLHSRRSVRAYAPKPLSREEIAELLHAARAAPTAVNRRAVRWIAFTERTSVADVARLCAGWLGNVMEQAEDEGRRAFARFFLERWQEGEDLICRGAPNLVLAHAPSDQAHMAQDAAIALTHLDLAAQARGLGTCWAGLVTSAASEFPELAAYLELPEGHAVYGGLMLGRPALRYHRLPPRPDLPVRWR
ncbi:nitroreductase family protein [Desulfohalovibrio reitneri]|uniref:nitroreductase family protein n=1 Tax=Desulfohalovibrio reitneri TaxID=1307759 RepID=UPI0004A764C7|nr:nitroreductase family protein [Desulfohalovibrio reitneri]